MLFLARTTLVMLEAPFASASPSPSLAQFQATDIGDTQESDLPPHLVTTIFYA